jgi:UDP:flavonoid glycosyltransferase YjiC (YdhE family)
MAKILYTWELGADLGHIQRFLSLAPHLRARGHDVVLAAQDLSRAQNLPGAREYLIVQAPLWLPKVKNLPDLQANYADILQRQGYLDPTGLLGLAKGWRALFDLIAPQLLIADHSPTALLAARGLSFPRVTFGSGFFSPPRTTPMPSMHPQLNIPAQRLLDNERTVLPAINHVLAEFGQPAIVNLADLLDVDETFLMTPQELDHYRDRGPAEYMGPILSGEGGATPPWPDAPGKKVFAYIKSGHRLTERFFTQLLDGPFNVLAYVPGLTEERCRIMQAPNIHFSPNPVDMRYATRHARIVLCHAGIGTILHALLAGLPLLLLPTFVEQCLMADNVVRIGAGTLIHDNAKDVDFNAHLRELTRNPQYAKRAKIFAARYTNVNADAILDRVVARCEALITPQA